MIFANKATLYVKTVRMYPFFFAAMHGGIACPAEIFHDKLFGDGQAIGDLVPDFNVALDPHGWSCVGESEL